MKARITAAILLASAAVWWLASRMTWIDVSAFDDKSGPTSVTITGASWAPGLGAGALALLAAAVAILVVRSLARRIIGALAALIAALVSWIPVSTLISGADPQRAFDLLTHGTTSQRANHPVSISEWSQITATDVAALGPVLVLLAAAVALCAAIVLVVRPGADGARTRRYERPAQRTHKVRAQLAEQDEHGAAGLSEESGRVLWDALDADIDPTDTQPGPTPNENRG
ncbi:TIGR02234 family membrane protein [Corynebacterium uberis]|uniref:TIGR02234 family membrane protein n=1 Tax=Corynebacterium TaxID=1716 RepID=UPI001D0B0849|nr:MULTISPECIES: TIGR02234 family membrane protein [Corynebacterium]MCZ9308369.1 TIGR02234 family membrane protein [Corynebacterium sp. c6VSa_13]UDL74040.1 TIGR02234 family membrane protein [Corynebacterium uberis]UDL75076.1 TIGR02234 family membrane protein [Corynebacterium uberis]UDL77289.1 TIGR02234 family membrane protein [Corynebacterium uberis]UDL79573.1 TIGR02234 family membrane protein [Corynebacterium uberis]